MYCDAIDSLVGKNITAFLSKGDFKTGLNGVLLQVSKDYIILAGKNEGEKNYIPMASILSIIAVTE
jgi:hypothetical protein